MRQLWHWSLRRTLALALIALLAWGLALLLEPSLDPSLATLASPTPYAWALPVGLPKPVVPTNNPITLEKIALGRYLFYDRRLSVTGKFACASCHEQKRAFTDGKPVSIGATGEPHPRNAMSLANVAYNSVLTWSNPGMTRLEAQALVPMFGEHPVELGLAGREVQLLQMLRHDTTYPKLFAAAFGANPQAINLSNLTKALASFERSLISFNSPYDRYRFGGEANAISASAKRGEQLFHSERLECFHCHGGLNFSDSLQHERLAFTEIAFHNTGLYNIGGKGAYPVPNRGVYEFTRKPADMGRFKAPTLRNIALTAPYMHDGSIATLAEVLEHYRLGGRTIKTGPYAGIGRNNPYKSNFVTGFQLTSQEKSDLLAFLNSLTDTTFISNPAFSDPFQLRRK
jgi:cytochrome c peroxidase